MRHFILILALATTQNTGLADTNIYKSESSEGNPIFSDSPTLDSKEIELESTNSLPPPAHSPSNAEEPSAPPSYSSLSITQPGSIIPNGLNGTRVTVNPSPPLRAGHTIELLIDGQSQGRNTSGTFSTGRLERGSRTLKARIMDGDEILLESPQLDTFVYWPGGN